MKLVLVAVGLLTGVSYGQREIGHHGFSGGVGGRDGYVYALAVARRNRHRGHRNGELFLLR